MHKWTEFFKLCNLIGSSSRGIFQSCPQTQADWLQDPGLVFLRKEIKPLLTDLHVGCSVLGKTVPSVLSMAFGLRPLAVLKIEGSFSQYSPPGEWSITYLYFVHTENRNIPFHAHASVAVHADL